MSIGIVNRRVYGDESYAFGVQKKETFGERTKRLREALRPRMSQTKLAAAVGIKQPSLSAIENGDTTPDNMRVPTLDALAKHLRTTREHLLTGTEPPAAPEDDPLFKQLEGTYATLNTASRQDLVEYADYLLSKQRIERPATSAKRRREPSHASPR